MYSYTNYEHDEWIVLALLHVIIVDQVLSTGNNSKENRISPSYHNKKL